MSKFSGFPLKKAILLGALVGGFSLVFNEANAQEENSPKPVEKPIVEEQGTSQEGNVAVSPLFKTTTQKNITSNATAAKRDLPVGGIIQEKELRKNESPSTLSFNIFLYIVDKFRED